MHSVAAGHDVIVLAGEWWCNVQSRGAGRKFASRRHGFGNMGLEGRGHWIFMNRGMVARQACVVMVRQVFASKGLFRGTAVRLRYSHPLGPPQQQLWHAGTDR